jgi:hypothetical protein
MSPGVAAMKQKIQIVLYIMALIFLPGCSFLKSNSQGALSSINSALPWGAAGGESSKVCLLEPTGVLQEADAASRVAVDPEKAPSIEIPEISFNFGSVSGGKDFVHKFSVKNVGKSVLSIKKILPG